MSHQPQGVLSCILLLPPSLLSWLAGETIKIVIEDYVQHLSGYHFQLKFDPELLFNQRFQYQNRIAAEFNTLYHWHPLMPDTFNIEGRAYTYPQFVFNNSLVTEHGINNLVESFTKQLAGRGSCLVGWTPWGPMRNSGNEWTLRS